jgi:2'-5' RNA ligase
MKKPENSTIINVCVFPDERVSAECVDISQSFRSDDTLFVLDGDNFFAHMTAFMARFPDDKIDEVVSGVEAALQSAQSFRCEHTGYFMTAGRYLEASYRKSDDFMKLHESLISHIAQLRISPGDPYEEGYFTPYTAEQQQNARETGYDLARNLYRPHVTLTRYQEGGVPEVFPAIPAANLSFNLGKVCVYKADDNGAVYELIREFQVAA